MIEAYARMLRNYVVFRGRTTRYEFWSFVLVQSVITIVALILSGVVHDAVGILLTLYLLVTLTPTLAGVVRRLHDIGRGFWWLPLGVGLAPVALVLVVVGLQFLGIGLVGGTFSIVGLAVADPVSQDAVKVFENFFELGLALLGFGVTAALVGGALAIVLVVFLATPGNRGENRYGPQPE